MTAATALVVRTGALGDVLLLRCAVAALVRAGHRVALLAPGPAGGALVGPGGSEVGSWLDASRADLAALWAPEAPLPAAADDALAPGALALVASGDEALARNLARLGARVLAQAPAPPPGVHAARWIARPLEALGLAIPDDVPPLVPTASEADAAHAVTDRLPARFLAIHPGSGSPRKNWPAERYAALAAAFTPGKRFLVVRGPADDEAAAPLAGLAHAVVADGLPLRVLAAVLGRAGLFVGNDSGVTHLAAAAGAPVLALFGPTDPAQWAPVGPRVSVRHAPDLGALAVADVAGAAATLWESARPRAARGPRSR